MGAQVSRTDQMNNAQNQKKESDNKWQGQKAARASLRTERGSIKHISAGLSKTMESSAELCSAGSHMKLWILPAATHQPRFTDCSLPTVVQ